ncbi:UNVERIFIED_CONTAM: hypothetical protein Sradi_0899700 [Sesamum radiatum]|uniref:Aminotransferase-like plant mobile domain-containing protein n=1 Tax=Sesamum radiatum TaxID=300843 RepID=A0AAW2V2G1_SESRA
MKRERDLFLGLYAYHLLQSADDNQCSHVSIDKLVKFWSKKTTEYHSPPPRKEKNIVRSKSTHNPIGDIAIHERWSTAEEALLAKLCIERSLKEEVYLAAYLACWLCVFILPGKDINSIRPSTFKMASLMANDRRVNLVILVLDEDKQVDGGENDPPNALIPPIVIECDSQAAVAEASKGKYSSHNVADSDSSNKDRHWKRPRKEVMPLKATETNENASRSSLANFVAELEDEVQSIDVGEEYETSHSSTMTPPLGMELRRKQSPPPAAVSVFKGESFLFNYQKEFLQRLWSGILVKISNTPVDFLSSIEDDVYLILEPMKSFQKFDVSKVEESLNTFFAKVHAYDKARSLSSEKLSRSLHEQQLKEVKARLQDVQAKASEEASEIQSAMDELEHIEEDIVVLKGRRTSLRATLKEKKQLNHDTQAKVHEVEKDLAALESTGPLDDAIVENLESSRANLGYPWKT